MKEKIEVVVRDKPWADSVEIYIIEKGYRTSVASVEKGYLKMTDVTEGAVELPPTLTLPLEVWHAIKTTLIDNKVREKSEVEAELGATKYHLQDMRKLLKLK